MAGHGRGDPPGAWTWLLAVNGLGLYVMIMYGITYYAVTTAAPRMAADFGWPASSVFGIITIALLASAVLAPWLGRMTDRVGAANVLLAGAALRSILLAAMAIAPEPVTFGLALLVVQILGLATEYDATFAATVDLGDRKARSGMSQITIWGGVASTVFWPATALLLDKVGWRTMFLLYAALMLAVCAPIAALTRAMQQATSRASTAEPSTEDSGDRRIRPGSAPFWLVATAFAFGGIAYNLPYLLLPVLDGLGFGASAVMIGMLFGPAQTAGRFFDMAFGKRIAPITVAVAASAVVSISLAVLLLGGIWAGVAFALLFGAGAGVGYVVRGSVMLALYGPNGYAASLGRLSTVRLFVTAMGPLALALILERFDARAVILACGAAAVLSLCCFALLASRTRATT